MEDTKEKISEQNAGKVSGGIDVARSSDRGGVWRVNCPKCHKEMIGGHGVSRVDGTVYEHPYFCEDCAKSLTDAEKNK